MAVRGSLTEERVNGACARTQRVAPAAGPPIEVRTGGWQEPAGAFDDGDEEEDDGEERAGHRKEKGEAMESGKEGR